MTRHPAIASRTLLSAFPFFRTADIDEARTEVARVFCNHGLRQSRGDQGLECSHNRIAVGRLALNFLSYGAEVEIDPGCLETFYLAQIPVAGRAEISSGQESVMSDSHAAVLLSPHRPTRMHWFADNAQVLLSIPRELVEMQEARMHGTDPGTVDFKLEISQEHGATAFWCRSVVDLVRNIDDHGGEWMNHHAAVASLEEFLLRGLLGFQRHACVEKKRVAPPVAVMPRHVRRAVEYIEANIGSALTVSEIAVVACASVRALEEGFRRYYSTTPYGYLRDRRLRHVRDILKAAAKDGMPVSVTEIAHSNGFLHLGRFAAYYKQCFGESPSATLRQP